MSWTISVKNICMKKTHYATKAKKCFKADLNFAHCRDDVNNTV